MPPLFNDSQPKESCVQNTAEKRRGGGNRSWGNNASAWKNRPFVVGKKNRGGFNEKRRKTCSFALPEHGAAGTIDNLEASHEKKKTPKGER